MLSLEERLCLEGEKGITVGIVVGMNVLAQEVRVES